MVLTSSCKLSMVKLWSYPTPLCQSLRVVNSLLFGFWCRLPIDFLQTCEARRICTLTSSRDLQQQKLSFQGWRNSSPWPFQDVKDVLDHMDYHGSQASFATYAALFQSIKNARGILDGKLLQEHIAKNGLQANPFWTSLVIEMYGKCGAVKEARLLFDKIDQRNLFPWKFIIRAYAQYGQGREALQLFKQMLEEGIIPDMFTFVSVLTSCAKIMALREGIRIHTCVVGNGYESDVAIKTALISMYSKCSSLNNAMRMFNEILQRNVLAWNAMISACVRHGNGKEALEYFNQMQREGVLPNRVTFVSILSACTICASLACGERLQACICVSEFRADIAMGNATVNMYCKCGSLEQAQKTFNEMSMQNVVSWTAVVAGYVQHGQYNKAFHLFERMQQEGVLPDKVAFIVILEACTKPEALGEGKKIHTCIVGSGLEPDIALGTAILNMYGKCGSPEHARWMFDKMPQHNLISWTAMISAHAQNEQGNKAFQIFNQMLQEGFMPDKVAFVNILEACCSLAGLREGKFIHARLVGSGCESECTIGTALINMYGKYGSLEEAHQMFENITELDVVSWTAMIAVFAQYGQQREALHFFNEMQQEGVMPDKLTFVSILDACACTAALVNGVKIHARISGGELETDVGIGTALINMYGKCGNLEAAWRTFDGIPMQNLISCTALIAAYAQHGDAKDALQVFNKMHGEGFLPDDVTFVNILSACSRAGLLDEGYQCFVSMIQTHGIVPMMDHFSCMVHLLGKAGLLNEAEELVNSMPLQPSAVLWMTLLGACRCRIDIERGERAAKHVLELDSDHTAPYVMLSNIYTAADGCDWCGIKHPVEKKLNCILNGHQGFGTDTLVEDQSYLRRAI